MHFEIREFYLEHIPAQIIKSVYFALYCLSFELCEDSLVFCINFLQFWYVSLTKFRVTTQKLLFVDN
jgi:hypothetical protein